MKFFLSHSLLATRTDVQNSKQPITSKSGRWILAFNGEIYNTSFLINAFDLDIEDSRSDTQVLIQLIEKLGTKFANHIDGMFAIALFDVASRTVHLFRDTSGQKNLYYSIRSNTIYFASEIEALFSLSIGYKNP